MKKHETYRGITKAHAMMLLEKTPEEVAAELGMSRNSFAKGLYRTFFWEEVRPLLAAKIMSDIKGGMTWRAASKKYGWSTSTIASMANNGIGDESSYQRKPAGEAFPEDNSINRLLTRKWA